MATEEYDVKSRIEFDTTRGQQGLQSVAEVLRSLGKDLTHFATAATAALGSVKPAAAQFTGAVKTTTTAVHQLEQASAKMANTSAAALAKMSAATTRVEDTTKRTNTALSNTASVSRQAASGIGSLVRSAVAFAGAYVGVRMFSSALERLVVSSFKYGEQTEKNRIALAAVLATQAQFSGQANPMEAAMRAGDQMYGQLQKDALKSVGSAQDLFSIYSGIAGPLMGAGASMTTIRTITNDTVSAAASLGVDFAQASRDINQMATGVAGQDTALFRMLRATGAIKEDTEAWNKMMKETPDKGVKALTAALGQFKASAAVYAASLPGLVTSFGDFMSRFRAAFMAGPLAAVQGTLARIISVFEKNEAKLSSVLGAMGAAFARLLDPALAALERFTNYLITNWQEVAARIERASMFAANVGATAQHYAPTLKVAAAGMVAARVAPGAASAVAAPIAAKAGALGAGALEVVKDLWLVLRTFGGFSAALGVFAAIGLVVVGIVGVMVDAWSALVPVFGVVWSVLQEFFGVLWGTLTAIMGVVMPIVKTLVVIVGIFGFIVGTLLFMIGRMVLELAQVILKAITWVFEWIGKGVQAVYEWFLELFKGVAGLFVKMNADINPKGGGGSFMSGFLDSVTGAMAEYEAKNVQNPGEHLPAESGAPTSRRTTINDFRGSKIEVKQDFRQADPDRVWVQMVEAVNGAAERRISSALVPDFTG